MAIKFQGASHGVTGDTVIVPKPAGATPGALLVAIFAVPVAHDTQTGYGSTNRNVSAATGWTWEQFIEQFSGGGVNGQKLYVFRKFLQLGESEWQFPTSVPNHTAGFGFGYGFVCLAYSGVDQTTPIDVEATRANTPASTSAVAAGVTTTVVNTRLITAFCTSLGDGFTASAPAGMTLRGSKLRVPTGNYVEPGMQVVFDQAVAAAGATGTRTSTISDAVESVATTLALRPDQSEPTAEASGFRVHPRFGVPTFLQETPPAPIDELLIAPDDSLVRIVAKLRPFDVSFRAELPLTVATVGLTTAPGDTPAGEHFREVLVDNVEISRSIFEGGALGGAGSVSLGSLTLLNGDGALDALPDNALEARDVELWVGGAIRRGDRLEELPWSDYFRFLVAKSGPAGGDLDSIGIPLTDGGAILDRWVQLNRYAGTGDEEGGADLAGVPKPIGLGTVPNAEPRLLSKVPLVYQFHDGDHGAARALSAVYDSGIKLPADLYTVDLSAGMFTLLTNPAGRITCDFTGPATAGDRAATFVKWLASGAGDGPLTFPNDFAADSYLAYEASQRASLGLYLREETKIPEALDQVVAPLGYWVFSRLGKLIVGAVEPPFGQHDLDIADYEVRSLQRRPTQRPFCRVSIGWGRNWTVQDTGELAGAAIASDQGLFAVEEHRVAHYPVAGRDADVLEGWPTAEERPMIPTLYVEQADAEAAAEAAFAIYGQPWDVFDVGIGLRGVRTDLGRVQRLTHARYGLERGKVFRVVAMTETSRGATLTLWAIAVPVVMVFEDEVLMGFEDDALMEF